MRTKRLTTWALPSGEKVGDQRHIGGGRSLGQTIRTEAGYVDNARWERMRSC